MRVGNLPPFLRIQLNAQLADKGQIPATIERTVIHKRGLRTVTQTVRSHHLANWRLKNTDRKLMDRAADHMATFRAVSFQEYVQLPDMASK
jgi:hypothetical protein